MRRPYKENGERVVSGRRNLLAQSAPIAALILVLPWLDGGRSELGRLVLPVLAGVALLLWSAAGAMRPPGPVLVAASVAAVLWPSLAWSTCPDQSLRALLMVSSATVVLWVLSSLPGWTGRHLVYAALALSLLACGASAVLEALQGQGVPSQWLDPPLRGRVAVRASGPFENPNLLGGFAALSLPLVLGYCYEVRRWLAALAALGVGAAVIALGLSFSRAGWLGGAVGLIAAAPAVMRQPRRAHLRLIPLAAAGLALMVWQAPSVSARVSTVPSPKQGTFAHRLFMWRAGANLWRASPWVGTGPGTYEARYAAARPHGVFELYAILTEPGSAHSDYVQCLAETGVLGVVVVAGLGWTIFRWRRQLSRAGHGLAAPHSSLAMGALGCLAAAAAGGLFQSNLRMPLCLLLVALAVDTLGAPRVGTMTGMSRGARVFAGVIALAAIGTASTAYSSDRAVGMGLMLAVDDRYAEAEDILVRARRLNPLDARTHVILGDIAASRHLRAGSMADLAVAATYYRRALRLDPFAGAIHAKLGDVLERQHHTEAALVAWRRACALDWYHASYHVQAGRLALELGHRATARAHLQLALRLFPLWLQLTEDRQGRDAVTAQLLHLAEADARRMLQGAQ